jgi:hypothetical protein
VSFGLSRHQVRALPALAGLVALGVHALATLPRGRIAAAVGCVAVLGGLGTRLPLAWAPRTLHAEYAFLRAHLADVPDGCVIVTYRYPGDAGLAPQPQLSAMLGRSHRWQFLGDPLPSSGCVVWYRPANCVTWTHAEAARAARGEAVPDDACAAFEASHVLTPLATAHLPAGRWVFENPRVVPVPVGLYRVSVPPLP